MKYLIEKGNTMPLCAVVEDIYIDYLSGNVIENNETLKFIKTELKNKSIQIKNISLIIYEIIDVKDNFIIAFKYVINNVSNYLNKQNRILSNYDRQAIANNLLNGKYRENLIWNDDDNLNYRL